MTIREGHTEDIPRLIEFGALFAGSLPGKPRHLNYQAMANYLRGFIEAPHGALFVSETREGTVSGFISGFVLSDPFSGETVGMKASWLTDDSFPSHGLQLLQRFERWARDMDAERIMASCLVGSEKVSSLLLRYGYEEVETKFEKGL